MNEEIKAILDRIKKHYVLDEGQDIILLNYITNLQEEKQNLKEEIEEINVSYFSLFKRYDKIEKENQKLNKIIDELENYLKVGIAMNFNMNNDKYSEQTIDNYNDILNKLTELKNEVE